MSEGTALDKAYEQTLRAAQYDQARQRVRAVRERGGLAIKERLYALRAYLRWRRFR